jgi:hypothetical protein
MRSIAAAVTVALWAAVAAAQGEAEPAVPAGPVRTVEADVSVGAALEARVQLPVGEIVVRGEDVDRIYARLQVFCERKSLARCEKAARGLALAGEMDGDRVLLAVKGVSEGWLRRVRSRLELRVPRRLPLDVHLHSGQVRIDDVVASTKVGVDKGTVDLALPGADVGELALKAGGRISVAEGGETLGAKGTIYGELLWQRPGRIARIEAKVDVGDVRVTLH